MKINYLAIIGLFVITSSSSFAADLEKGKTVSAMCAACHGADGNSTNPIWPKIAGQHANYIVKQLHDFKSGARVNAQMQPIAASLSDEDMANVAAYYANQKSKPGKADPEFIELGEKIYRAGNHETHVPACMACHGPAGAGNPGASYPAVAGQHAEYTIKQLNAFDIEDRENDHNSKDTNNVMRKVVGPMTKAEIEAVAEYIQGLH